jgi:hypothetical protein
MLRGDLAAASIPYAVEGTDGPLYADFHALRHTYLTLGGRAGIDLRTLQELAGHCTPNLIACYSHRRLYDRQGAVEKLPSILPGKAEAAQANAKGTDGPVRGCSMLARSAALSVHLESSPGTNKGGNGEGAALLQPLAPSSLVTTSNPKSSVHLAGLEPATFGSVALLYQLSQVQTRYGFPAATPAAARCSDVLKFRDFRTLSPHG